MSPHKMKEKHQLTPIACLVFLLHVIVVAAEQTSYCEWGMCEGTQYCCGANVCCTQTLDTWFFWSGVLLILVALAVGCVLRCSSKAHKDLNNYQKLVSNQNHTYTHLPKIAGDELHNSFGKPVPTSA